MKTSFVLAILASTAWAFPIMDNPETIELARQFWQTRDLSQDPLGISKAQTNCGYALEQFILQLTQVS